LSLVSHARGKVTEARACLDEYATLVEAWPLTERSGAALTMLALAWHTLGEHARAADLRPQLLPLQGEVHWVLVDRVLGLLALAQGDPTAAMTHLTRAAATARAEGLRPELAATLLAQGDAQRQAGGAGSQVRARALLTEARDLYASLGMARAAAEAGTHLNALTPTDLAGLSPKESAVVRLVALGWTDKQIAAALKITDHTVANHLSSSLRKVELYTLSSPPPALLRGRRLLQWYAGEAGLTSGPAPGQGTHT
jgi:DNA-binding NarL/FixJ family response regulator